MGQEVTRVEAFGSRYERALTASDRTYNPRLEAGHASDVIQRLPVHMRCRKSPIVTRPGGLLAIDFMSPNASV